MRTLDESPSPSHTIALAIAIVMQEKDCDATLATNHLVSRARQNRLSLTAVSLRVVDAGSSADAGPVPPDAA